MSKAIVINLEASAVEVTTTVPTECVLDVTDFGDVVGVEILNLAHTTGSRALKSHGLASLGSGKHVRWSYDQEADAFYVSICENRSPLDQRLARCIVGVASDGRLVSVTVDVDED